MPMPKPYGFLVRMSALSAVLSLGAGFAMGQELSMQRKLAIDAHALAAPPDVEKDSRALARYLTQNLTGEREKLRSIYRWIADRITYDVDTYLSGREVDVSPAEVLAKRQSVCEGFASLFADLAGHAGLKVTNIPGYAKGFGTNLDFKSNSKPNHMWTAVQIDGEWRMIDATWGAGYVLNGQYKKALSEAFFLVPPEQLAFSHFPKDAQWQLQKTPRMDLQEFTALPSLPITYFNHRISAVETWNTIKAPGFSGALVQTFDLPVGLAHVKQAPLTLHLQQTVAYNFLIESQTFTDMALVQGSQWTYLEKAGETFTRVFKPELPGDLMVLGKSPGSDSYVAILRYQVAP